MLFHINNKIMDWFIKLWGEGKDLDTIQMCSRGIATFIIALVLIRISGRRSFGIRTPLDNIIVILLGAVMSRAVVGASPFIPVMVTSFVIVMTHRILGWLTAKNTTIAKLVEGKKILLFKDGAFIKEHLLKALICEEDVKQGVRESALVNDMNKISEVYMERNGAISAVKKDD